MYLRVRANTLTTITKRAPFPNSSSSPPPPSILSRSPPWQRPHREELQSTAVPDDPHAYAHLLLSCSKRCSSSQSRHPFDEMPQMAMYCRVLHGRILKLGFLLVGKVGNGLIDLYSKLGDLGYAQKVLRGVNGFDVAAWNPVLSARSRMGELEGVVRSFVDLRSCSVSPDQFTFAIILSACGKLVALDEGKQVHAEALKSGFACGSFCVGSLIDMYAKCGQVNDARKVLEEVRRPDTVSWTAMIAGYTQKNMEEEALDLFARMLEEGCMPDRVTFVTAITACLSLGRLVDAQDLFMKMPSPNDIAWNAIISGNAQHGHEQEALGFFRRMRRAGINPTRSTLGSVLSACSNMLDSDLGCQVHSLAIRLGLDSNVYVGSSLINMYAKSCATADARKIFNALDEKNIVTWNAMLGGYAQNEQHEEMLAFFLEMKEHGLKCDEFTYVSLLSACACLGDLKLGQQLHSAIVKCNFKGSLFVGNAILDMYAKSGEINDAKQKFELMPVRDVVSWNAVIVGLVYNEYYEQGLGLFPKMRSDGFAPDEVSIACVLSACANIGASEEGRQVHCLSIKLGFEPNVYVGSSVVNLYVKLGNMEAAERAFIQMPEISVASTNALIEGYVLNNDPDQALSLFQQLLNEGMSPSKFTFTSVLPACIGSLGLNLGLQLHCHTLKSGLLYSDIFLGVSLVGMYMRSQSHCEAVDRLFLEVPYKSSVILWTAIISGHTQNGSEWDALLFFSKMHAYNVRPDQAAFVSVLRACADLASLKDGKEIHSLVIRTGYYSDECISSSLVDLYSKCGDIGASYQVFNEIENKADIVSWNSMVVGFAKNGFAEEALALFSQMEQSKVQPDDITFLGVLTACSHAGLVAEGRSIFDSMTGKYGIEPRYDHYACMVDLLSRGGNLREAEELIDTMPFEPDSVIWSTLLSACRVHGDCRRGEKAAKNLINLDPSSSSPYVLLSNMCALSGNWDGVTMMRKAMNKKGVKKMPGCSWIMVGNNVNFFVSGGMSRPDANNIFAALANLTALMKLGYAAETDFLWYDDI